MDVEDKHKKIMREQKRKIDKRIQQANIERGLVVLLSGDGKGKSSSAFGMVMRCLGYQLPFGIVQFIKGQQLSGEELFLQQHFPKVPFHQMATGFTWDTQDRAADIKAAKKAWSIAEQMLNNPQLYMVLLDELTYMLSFKYLDTEQVVDSILRRPSQQTVIITGRGGGKALRDIADTYSEIKMIKHAYNQNIKARKGIDY